MPPEKVWVLNDPVYDSKGRPADEIRIVDVYNDDTNEMLRIDYTIGYPSETSDYEVRISKSFSVSNRKPSKPAKNWEEAPPGWGETTSEWAVFKQGVNLSNKAQVFAKLRAVGEIGVGHVSPI